MNRIFNRLVLASTLGLLGCSHVLVRPQADEVKKVAVVSVYMNRQIYNVEAPKKADGQGMGELVKSAASNVVTGVLDATLGDTGGYQPVVTAGLQSFSNNLNISGRWQVVPAPEIVGQQSYKDFAASAGINMPAEWVGVEGMMVLPMASVIETGNTYNFGSETSYESRRKALGKLAQDLGVDGVAIVELDAAYEIAAFNFPMGLRRATPDVSVAAAIIDRNGDIALKTPLVVRGDGDRYEGETVGMLQEQYVRLSEAEVQSSYNGAFEQAAVALRERIVDEFGN